MVGAGVSVSKLLLIGLGGFCGAIGRYLIGTWANDSLKLGNFPIGTFIANILGCLLIGYLSQTLINRDLFTPDIRAMILTGFLGAFTTFSTFSNETFMLFRNGELNMALGYVAGSLIVGLLAVWLGFSLAT